MSLLLIALFFFKREIDRTAALAAASIGSAAK
jgi:hypothetical protein